MPILKTKAEKLPVGRLLPHELLIVSVVYDPITKRITLNYTGDENEDAQMLLMSGLDMLTGVISESVFSDPCENFMSVEEARKKLGPDTEIRKGVGGVDE